MSADDIVWEVEDIVTKRYAVSFQNLKESFPDEYAECKRDGLTDEEFIEDCLDNATPFELAIAHLSEDYEMNIHRQPPREMREKAKA